MRPPLISVFMESSFLNRRHVGTPQTFGEEDIQNQYNIVVLIGYQVHRLGAGGNWTHNIVLLAICSEVNVASVNEFIIII